jgi:putative tricarboxylic transport membrane protein
LLLAMMTLHGLVPGKALMTNQLDLVFALIWSLFFSNWLTSIVGVMIVAPLSRLTVLRTQVLSPVIFSLAALGAFAYKARIEDVAAAFGFGVAGYYLKKHGWPRIPLVIAVVLGPLFETNLRITLQLQRLGRIEFWRRPIALALVILTIVTLALPFIRSSGAKPSEAAS